MWQPLQKSISTWFERPKSICCSHLCSELGLLRLFEGASHVARDPCACSRAETWSCRDMPTSEWLAASGRLICSEDKREREGGTVQIEGSG